MSEEIKNENLDESTEQNNENENEQVTLSKDELKKMIESESDKKLDKVLSKKKAEWEASIDEKVEQKLKEDKRLSKLSEAERKEEQLSKREQEIAKREADIERNILRSETITELSERKLDTRLVDFVLGEDGEKTNDNIKLLASIFDETKKQAVKEFTRQSTPSESETIFSNNNNRKKTTAEIAREKRIIK